MNNDKRAEVEEVVFHKDAIYGSVIHKDKYDDDYLIEFIVFLQEKLASIPEPYRHSARINIDSDGGFSGDSHAELSILYMRPETDGEMQIRLTKKRVREKGKEQ